MDKQEEIREGIYRLLIKEDIVNGFQRFDWERKMPDKILTYLESKGVVIKVERELPSREHWDWEKKSFAKDCYFDLMLEAGYAAVVPIIKENNERT